MRLTPCSTSFHHRAVVVTARAALVLQGRLHAQDLAGHLLRL